MKETPKDLRTASPKKMIFWSYDQFPYMLASPGHMDDNGLAYVPSYMGYFKPVKVMSLESGKKLKTKLETLAAERTATYSSVHKGFMAQLDMIAPWRRPKC